MPYVRLSGSVLGIDNPARQDRAKLLYLLYDAGWDILNSSGGQQITLSNIEEKITESDAFLFTPGCSLQDMFKAISVFVGYQTMDKHLFGKPTVILNNEKCWDPFFAVLTELQRRKTVKQDHTEYLLNATSPEDAIEKLHAARSAGVPDAGRVIECRDEVAISDTPPPASLKGNVCVFCSASLEDPAYISDGESLGARLAHADFGCVSGAGKTGIMGAVVRGSVGAGGWTAGSNVPHIIELEGLPDGLSRFWLRDDIYTRMEVMIENSDAFVIFPGGAGTVQELLALIIYRHQDSPMMKHKPIVIFNRPDEEGHGFWDSLIELLEKVCQKDDYTVATTLDEVDEILAARVPLAYTTRTSSVGSLSPAPLDTPV